MWILRDPYSFEFLTLSSSAKERELERGLLKHLRDLLLFHLRLHFYFVIELKNGAFKPEYAGKLSFYLSAVDGMMRTPVDGPSIGLLLCETRSGPIVEYTLQNIVQPIGVSTYRVTRELPEPVREELPSVEDLQEVVNKLRSEMESLRKELPNEE